jgi:hypothetical protein
MTKKEPTDLPDGQISSFAGLILSSPLAKNIPLSPSGKSSLQARPVPSHSEGRLAIVTDAGRDAVDADAPITNGTEADGEGVWS